MLKSFFVCVAQVGTCHMELILSLYYFASEIKGSSIFSSFLVSCIPYPGPLAKMLFFSGALCLPDSSQLAQLKLLWRQ